MRRQQVKTAVFWAVTILGPASFVIGGVFGLIGGPQVVDSVRHLGYPLYFARILGAWKLLGAIAIAAPGLPRLKEWAYAGFVFDLTAAAASHAAVGDSAADIAAPLMFLALVLASWALRPAGRRLAGAAARQVSASASDEPSAALAAA
jgi:hypothetical protein